MDISTFELSLALSFFKYPIEKLGEKITKQWEKAYNWFKKPHNDAFKNFLRSSPETTVKELEALANQNPEFKQDIINLVKAIEKEYPTEFQSIKDEFNRNKLQEINAKTINSLFQGNNISGGNVGNSGGTQIGTQIGTQNNTTYNTHNTNI